VPALLVFVISLLLALSLWGRAGRVTLWHLDLPRPMMAALTSLRSSGRLFWPGYYVVFAGIIAAAFKAFPARRLQVALAVAVGVQFLDLAPLRALVYDQWQSTSTPDVPPAAAWHELGATQRHLVVVPAWQCPVSPGGYLGYAIFGRLALAQHMTINSFYAGRYSDAQMDYFCGEQTSQIEAAGLRDDTAYVFKGDMTAGLISLQYNGKYCRRVDEYTLCSQVLGRSGLDPAILRDVVTLHSGDVVPFSRESAAADKLIGLGWSDPEQWGRWMGGHVSRLAFKVPNQPLRDVQIELSVVPLMKPSHKPQRVGVLANGEPVADQTFGEGNDATLDIVVPAHLIGSDGLVQLLFNLPDAVSSREFGMTAGPRERSIGVKQLRIIDAGD
ncbi:MAG TPA: hypothetical protein VGM32_03320, partial [Rhodopila sp.]